MQNILSNNLSNLSDRNVQRQVCLTEFLLCKIHSSYCSVFPISRDDDGISSMHGRLLASLLC